MSISVPDLEQRLALSCTPRADESLPGFLMRLANWAKLPSAAYLAEVSGFQTPQCTFIETDYVTLAKIAGLETASLEFMSYAPSKKAGYNLYFGQEIPRAFLEVHRRQACAACLAEDCYHRGEWDTSLAASCPKHALRLLRACGNCNARLGWQSSYLDRCERCGQTLTPCMQDQASSAEVQAICDVSTLIHGKTCKWLPAELAGESPTILLEQAKTLAMMSLILAKNRKSKPITHVDVAQVAEIACVSMNLLRTWPQSFTKLVETKISTEDERSGQYGARKSLGNLYKWITHLPEGPMRNSALKTGSSIVARDPVRGHRMHRSALFIEEGTEAAGTTIKQAKDELNMSFARVKRLAAAGLLTIRHSDGRGVPAMVDKAQLAALIEVKDHLIDLKGASQIMGLDEETLRWLLEDGLIPYVCRPQQNGPSSWGIDRRELLKILDRLESGAPSGETIYMVGLKTAQALYRRSEVYPIPFYQNIFEGKLKPCGIDIDQVGLQRLLFPGDYIKADCRRLNGSPPYYTIQGAAWALEEKWHVVKELTEFGLLEMNDNKILPEELKRFSQDVISSTEMINDLQTSSGYLYHQLEKANIRPISGRKINGGLKYFYQRTNELLIVINDMRAYIGKLKRFSESVEQFTVTRAAEQNGSTARVTPF